MLKLFQEGVIPEKIPELVLEVNDKFLKSIGEPETMRKQAIRFEKVKDCWVNPIGFR